MWINSINWDTFIPSSLYTWPIHEDTTCLLSNVLVILVLILNVVVNPQTPQTTKCHSCDEGRVSILCDYIIGSGRRRRHLVEQYIQKCATTIDHHNLKASTSILRLEMDQWWSLKWYWEVALISFCKQIEVVNMPHMHPKKPNGDLLQLACCSPQPSSAKLLADGLVKTWPVWSKNKFCL